MTSLRALKTALERPFPIDVIDFVPTDIRKEGDHFTCIAYPCCHKQVYEDRLNTLVYGEWQTPYAAPILHEHILVIPATVIICGVTHTDYGHAVLTPSPSSPPSASPLLLPRPKDPVSRAYEHAFREACAKFGLGYYLSRLRPVELPYDSAAHCPILSSDERLALIEHLYQECHLPISTDVQRDPSVARPLASPSGSSRLSDSSQPITTRQGVTPLQSSPVAPLQSTSTSERTSTARPLPELPLTAYPDEVFLDWAALRVQRDPQRIQSICDFYGVAALPELTQSQRENLTQRLERQHAREQREHGEPAQAPTAQPA